jgi:hypothetical protein
LVNAQLLGEATEGMVIPAIYNLQYGVQCDDLQYGIQCDEERCIQKNCS